MYVILIKMLEKYVFSNVSYVMVLSTYTEFNDNNAEVIRKNYRINLSSSYL